MIYPYTAILHGVLAALCFISFFYLIYFKKDLDKATMRAYFNWFLYFFLYNTILMLPLLIFSELSLLVGRFFNVAMIFLGLAAWQAFNMSLNLLITNELKRKLFSFFYLIGISIAVVLYFIYAEIPKGSDDGNWVLWYSGEYISLFYSLFMFIAGWTFSYTFLKSFLNFQSPLLKTRIILYALASFMLPFASFFYFGVQNTLEVYLSFALSILGMILFAIGNVFIGILLKSSQQIP